MDLFVAVLSDRLSFIGDPWREKNVLHCNASKICDRHLCQLLQYEHKLSTKVHPHPALLADPELLPREVIFVGIEILVLDENWSEDVVKEEKGIPWGNLGTFR
jgi:hypothetical protein